MRRFVMARNTTARFLHDVSLAAWFGGGLMGAVGLNGAANDAKDSTDRVRIAAHGWARWAPVNAAAIGLHLLAGAQLVRANKGRLAGQKGVAKTSVAKTALTGAAVAVTAYSGYLGMRVGEIENVPAEGGTKPSAATPDSVARDLQMLRALQWAQPALTGGLVLLNAVMGEQQRPSEVARAALARTGKAALAAASNPAATAKAARVAARQAVSNVPALHA